jgi:regulatory protein
VDPTLDSALTKALGALQRRERTVAELHAWLVERDVPAEVAEEAIAELVEIGQLDDERFAFAFAEDKRDLSGWGGGRIEAALLDRGIGRGLAERACVEPREAELNRAAELARSRGEDLDDDRARSRTLSFLIRRGFEYELAYDAIRAAARTGPASV